MGFDVDKFSPTFHDRPSYFDKRHEALERRARNPS